MNPLALSIAQPLVGGVLIGVASWLLLASLGRVAGISGIAAGALVPSEVPRDNAWRWAFIAGLVIGGAVLTWWLAPPLMAPRSGGLLIAAGLLVGLGTVLGSGCTSGHGVCGLGRLSPRSLVAVPVFMGMGMLTVWIMRSL
jgi:uncharacterized protein